MLDFQNAMRRQALSVMSRLAQPRWGLVTNTRSTDTGYEIRVMLQPEEVLTGWLPVISPMVGAGWGLVSPPALNSQAFIIPDNGRADHGVAIGMGFSTDMMPPMPGGNAVTEGQFALVHKNGSYLLFDDNDVHLITTRDLIATVGRNASIIATGTADIGAPTINIDADGKGGNTTVNIKGNLNVSENVSDGHGSMDRLRGNYDAHGHTNVQGGQGVSGPTTKPDSE